MQQGEQKKSGPVPASMPRFCLWVARAYDARLLRRLGDQALRVCDQLASYKLAESWTDYFQE